MVGGVLDVDVALCGVGEAHEDSGGTQADALIVDVVLKVGREGEDFHAAVEPSWGATERFAEFLGGGVELASEVVDLGSLFDG